MNLDTVLKFAGLLEELSPVAAGVVSAIRLAHSQGRTVQDLLDDAATRFQNVADTAAKEQA